jgi:hypothetical protein
MKMKFGAYKGTDMAEVPTGYLEYLLEQAEITSVLVRNELEKRNQNKVLQFTQS